MEWNYLNSPPFHIRHALAAYHVRNFDTILEIGSYKQPISNYLSHPFKHCICIDPRLDEKQEERILHARADYRTFDYTPLKTPYALILLGLELPIHTILFDLLNTARRVIIELATELPQAQILLQLIRDFTLLKESFRMHFNLEGNDFGDMTNSHPPLTKRDYFVFDAL